MSPLQCTTISSYIHSWEFTGAEDEDSEVEKEFMLHIVQGVGYKEKGPKLGFKFILLIQIIYIFNPKFIFKWLTQLLKIVPCTALSKIPYRNRPTRNVLQSKVFI